MANMKNSFNNVLFSVTLLCVALFVATSCSEESKFKEFAIDFAHAVNSGDTLKIDALLAQPNSYQFSQVSLAKINPDSIQLVEDGEGKYKVTSVGDVCMVVSKVGDKMVVNQTWKIFNGEPESIAFALKQNLIKEADDDKSIYDVLHSEEYAAAKEAELAAQKFAQEQEEAQKVISKTLASFADVVNTLQNMYNEDPGSIWWSMNHLVVAEAENNKHALDSQSKYMTPEQTAKYQMLVKQYNRLIN